MIKTIFSFIFLITSTIIYGQVNRYQEPKEPFSYISEEVEFKNTKDTVVLSGTFTFPKKKKDFPIVILISGSGPQNRDSEIFDHKPFLVIADYLTRNDIAVLRVDDRGVDKSSGNYNTSGIENFKNDTEAAVKFLREDKRYEHSKIGLVGHSLGGLIAPWIASERKDVSFIILLSAPGLRGDKLISLQKELIERKLGVPETTILEAKKNFAGAYKIIINSNNNDTSLKSELKTYFKEVFGDGMPQNQVNSLSNQLTIPWLYDLIRFDPKNYLTKVTCPVLALNGLNDIQVPAEENLTIIKQSLLSAGDQNVTTLKLENLNHLFQESDTGLPNEYQSIDQTFSPEVLEIMSNWIKMNLD